MSTKAVEVTTNDFLEIEERILRRYIIEGARE